MKTLFNSPRPPRRQFQMILILLFLCLGWTALPLTAQQASQPKDQTQDRKESFGGSFKTLNPEQQKLVVNLVQAYGRAAKTQVDPEKVYDASSSICQKHIRCGNTCPVEHEVDRPRWEIVGYRA